jgi:hypothetical protein
MPVAEQCALRVAIARDQGCHRRVGALDDPHRAASGPRHRATCDRGGRHQRVRRGDLPHRHDFGVWQRRQARSARPASGGRQSGGVAEDVRPEGAHPTVTTPSSLTEPIAAFLWPLLVQAGGLAELCGGRLRLTAKGSAASSVPPVEIIHGRSERWVANRGPQCRRRDDFRASWGTDDGLGRQKSPSAMVRGNGCDRGHVARCAAACLPPTAATQPAGWPAPPAWSPAPPTSSRVSSGTRCPLLRLPSSDGVHRHDTT